MDSLIEETIASLERDHIRPLGDLRPILLIICKKSDIAAQSYIKGLKKKATLCNVKIHVRYGESVAEVVELIQEWRVKLCDGILIASNYGAAQDSLNNILPTRLDVDGQSSKSLGALWGDSLPQTYCLAPCTAIAALKIVSQFYDGHLSGKKICVIGRSKRVGRPLAEVLLQQDATVTLLHSRSPMDDYLSVMNYDAIISAIGRPKLLTAKRLHLQEDSKTLLVDVGINVGPDGKMCGDFDYEDLRRVVPYITPSPGGVGAVTTTVLFCKLFRSKASFLGEL